MGTHVAKNLCLSVSTSTGQRGNAALRLSGQIAMVWRFWSATAVPVFLAGQGCRQ